jgi:NAD(P)H-nitrite reductase large subunit
MLSQVLDERSSQYLQALFERNGARFWFDSDIKEIVRRKKGLKGIVTDKGEMVAGDMLIVGKGVSPNLDIVRDAGIHIDKGILVDDYMETNCEGVYAAGDVAQAKVITNSRQSSVVSRQQAASNIVHPVSSIRQSAIGNRQSAINHVPFKDILSLWPVGAEQGKIAGQNMTGEKRVYGGGVGSNSIEYFGLKAISMGITKGDGCEAILFEQNGIYRKYLFNGERLVGAVLLGDISDAGVLLHAIKQALPVKGFLLSADSRQKTEVGGQQTEDRGRRSEVGGQQTANSDQPSALRSPQSAICNLKSEIRSPLSALSPKLSLEVLF